MSRVPIRDGPAEGLGTSAGDKFVWLEVVAVKRRERTPNAGLYELRDSEYIYVGGKRSLCEGCGAVVDRVEGGSERPTCPLCGAGSKAA